MNQELWQYFKNCTVVDNGMRTHAGTQLTRSGLTDMDTLCEMLEQEPEKVFAIRNIGLKSIIAIQKVCEAYRHERGDVF